MWLVTTDGMFSVNKYEDKVNVRARARRDLKQFMRRLGIDEPIIVLERSDYPYRILIPRERLIVYLTMYVMRGLEYGNFKDAVALVDKERADVYHGVWRELLQIEEEENWFREAWDKTLHPRIRTHSGTRSSRMSRSSTGTSTGTGMIIDTDKVVTVGEIAAIAGVKPQSVANWQVRDVGFPEPLTEIAGVRLFDIDKVLFWLVSTGRFDD